MQDTKIRKVYAWRKAGTEEPIQLGRHTWFSRAAFAISSFCQTYRGWRGRDTKPTDYEIAEYELKFIKAEQPPVCPKCKKEILSNAKERAANICWRCNRK